MKTEVMREKIEEKKERKKDHQNHTGATSSPHANVKGSSSRDDSNSTKKGSITVQKRLACASTIWRRLSSCVCMCCMHNPFFNSSFNFIPIYLITLLIQSQILSHPSLMKANWGEKKREKKETKWPNQVSSLWSCSWLGLRDSLGWFRSIQYVDISLLKNNVTLKFF